MTTTILGYQKPEHYPFLRRSIQAPSIDTLSRGQRQRRSNYWKYREQGYDAVTSWHYAGNLVKWESAEDAELVKIDVEPEYESFADVYGDEIFEAEKTAIEQWGCHWVAGYYRLSEDDEWILGGSIGMVVDANVGDPIRCSVAPEIIAETLAELAKEAKSRQRCKHCKQWKNKT